MNNAIILLKNSKKHWNYQRIVKCLKLYRVRKCFLYSILQIQILHKKIRKFYPEFFSICDRWHCNGKKWKFRWFLAMRFQTEDRERRFKFFRKSYLILQWMDRLFLVLPKFSESLLASHHTGCLCSVSSLAFYYTGCSFSVNILASHHTKCLFAMNSLAYHHKVC